MKNLLAALICSTATLSSFPALAQGLPSLQEDPFIACFGGRETRESLYQLGVDGILELRIKAKDDRILSHKGIEVKFFIAEQQVEDKSRWTRKKFEKEDLVTEQEATEDPEKLSFVATVSNGAKARVTYYFKNEMVYFESELLDKGQAKRPLRIGFDLKFRHAYHGVKDDADEKDWKQRTRGEKFFISFDYEKPVKVKAYEPMSDILATAGDDASSRITELFYKCNDFHKRAVVFKKRKEGDAKVEFRGRATRGKAADLGVFTVYRDHSLPSKGPWAGVGITRK